MLRKLKRERNRSDNSKIAERSFLEATELEQILCSSNSSAANKEDVDMKTGYDMGW